MGAAGSHPETKDLSEIFPAPGGLYLSGRPRVSEDRLVKLQIGAILDITCAHTGTEHESPAPSPWDKIPFMNVPVFDTENSDLKRYFTPTIAFISDMRAKGASVLVHCEQGVSRSSTIVIAYLVVAHKMALIDAYREVVRARPIALPNTSFIMQLMQFENELKQRKESEECLLSVVLLERDIVPGLKDLGVTHAQITKAIRQHPDDWVAAVRQAMNEAAGDIQATLKLQKDGSWKVQGLTAVEKARAQHARKTSTLKRPSTHS